MRITQLAITGKYLLHYFCLMKASRVLVGDTVSSQDSVPPPASVIVIYSPTANCVL